MPASKPAIYVDVDDTLVRSAGSKRIPIPHVVALVRGLADAGAQLYLWSTAGADYARAAAAELGLADCFLAFLPKPDALMDDAKLSSWRFKEFHPSELSSVSAKEFLARLTTAP
jgi:hypothetical protein